IAEVFGIWNYQITPTLFLSTRLGPALNRPDEIEAERLVPSTPTLGSFLVDAQSCPQRGGVRVFSGECQLVVGQAIPSNAPTLVPVATSTVPLIRASFLNDTPDADEAFRLFGAVSLVKRWEQ